MKSLALIWRLFQVRNHQRPPTLVNGSYHSPEEPGENTSEIRFEPPSRSGDPTNAALVAMGKAAYGQLGQGSLQRVPEKGEGVTFLKKWYDIFLWDN